MSTVPAVKAADPNKANATTGSAARRSHHTNGATSIAQRVSSSAEAVPPASRPRTNALSIAASSKVPIQSNRGRSVPPTRAV